jgi:hypothetical protein
MVVERWSGIIAGYYRHPASGNDSLPAGRENDGMEAFIPLADNMYYQRSNSVRRRTGPISNQSAVDIDS